MWFLDEGEGKKVTDATGNGHNGTFVNDPQWVGGKFGMALSFGGVVNSVMIDDPILVDDEVVNFTMGCWVNPAEVQGDYATILSCKNSDAGENHRGVSLEQVYGFVNRFRLLGGNGEEWVGQNIATQESFRKV